MHKFDYPRAKRRSTTLSLAGIILVGSVVLAEARITRQGCHDTYNRCTNNCDRIYSTAGGQANCIVRCGGQYQSCWNATKPSKK